MSLTLRNVKGSELTYSELDDNFTYLESLAEGVGDLETVLTNGNSTGGTDIILTDGDEITGDTYNTSKLSFTEGANDDVTLRLNANSIINFYRPTNSIQILSDASILLTSEETYIGSENYENYIVHDAGDFYITFDGVGETVNFTSTLTSINNQLRLTDIGSGTPVNLLAVDANGDVVDAASISNFELLKFELTDETTTLTTGIKYTYYIPFDFTINDLFASVNTASTSGDLEIDIKKNGTSIFSTMMTIDENTNISDDASVAYVITTSTFTRGDKLEFEIINEGLNSNGLKLNIMGVRS